MTSYKEIEKQFPRSKTKFKKRILKNTRLFLKSIEGENLCFNHSISNNTVDLFIKNDKNDFKIYISKNGVYYHSENRETELDTSQFYSANPRTSASMFLEDFLNNDLEYKTKFPEIPNGSYCYTIQGTEPHPKIGVIIKTKHCPYSRTNIRKHEQMCGECTKFKIKDWEEGTLLWDGVKECGINDIYHK